MPVVGQRYKRKDSKESMIPYITTIPVHPRLKKSWWALLRLELTKANKEDDNPYFFQHNLDWESYNYLNFLKQVRAKYRGLRRVDPFPSVKAYQSHFQHHCGLLKRGTRKPTGRVQEY